MSPFNLLLNFLLVFPLLWVNGILGKWKLHSSSFFEYSEFGFQEISEENFSENFFQMIVHPPIYLALVCYVLQCISADNIIPNLWLLVPFYWAVRVAYAILRDTFAFTNWCVQIRAFFISILLSEGTLFFIILPLLEKDESIFIDALEFRDAFWYAALIYFAKLIWDSVKGKLVGETLFPAEKKTDVIIRRYCKYQGKYDKDIQYILNRECFFKTSNERSHFVSLIYAIMIYETHNRPFWGRMIEYLIKLVNPSRIMTLGIMQVKTNCFIGNKKSIHLAINKLYDTFSEADMPNKVSMSVYDYNPCDNYCEQVISIYEEITQYLDLPQLKKTTVKVKRHLATRRKNI